MDDELKTGPRTLCLTMKEAASELRVSEDTVQRLVREGAIPTLPVHALRRIARADLETFVRTHRERNGVPVCP